MKQYNISGITMPCQQQRIVAMCSLAVTLVCLPLLALAQISKPSESELNAVPPQFLDLVHGRSDKINQQAAPSRNGQPLPGATQPISIVNPSKDPRDFTGYWAASRGGPGGAAGALAPGGGPGVGNADPRPGTRARTEIDANRMCLVSLGVNPVSMKVYQSPEQLTFVYANELRARRIYFADKHAANPKLSYNGDSIAHWEGNTLVVDTIAIKGVITLLGFDVEEGAKEMLLATPTLHVVERIARSADGQQLTIESTWDDPASGAKPYTKTTTLSYTAETPTYDFQCEDVGDQFGPNYGGGVK